MSTEGTERDGRTERNDSGNGPDGMGPEGTIPVSDDGIAAGATDDASNFEPEEDDGGTAHA